MKVRLHGWKAAKKMSDSVKYAILNFHIVNTRIGKGKFIYVHLELFASL